LAGKPAEAPWDPKLAVAMAEFGLALEEEAVADLLAKDVLAANLCVGLDFEGEACKAVWLATGRTVIWWVTV
jgi:hypothetical protein